METKTIYIVGNATFESFLEAKNYEKYLKEKEFNELLENTILNCKIDLDNFNDYQLEEIKLGLKQNLDVSIYASPKFSAVQMSIIRESLEKGLDIKQYINSKLLKDLNQD